MNYKNILVSYADCGIYLKLIERFRSRCLHYDCPHIIWNKPPNKDRSHQVSPYGFKLHIIRDAIEKGFTTIVWSDSSAYLIKPHEEFFELVRKRGVVFLGAGDWLQQYVNTKSLNRLGFSRSSLEDAPLISGTIFGFDFTQSKAVKFFEEWEELESQNWFQEDNQGPDEIFKTHRHDEAIASVLLIKHGIDYEYAYDHINGDRSTNKNTFRAHKDFINESPIG